MNILGLISQLIGIKTLRLTDTTQPSHMARVPQFKAMMSILTKGKVWHILWKNLFSPIGRYSGKSHLCKKVLVVKMTPSVRSVTRYWLNVLLSPKKKT